MPHNLAYKNAEKKIEEARRTGATELSFSGMGLTELPESLGQLTQLQALTLFSNQLTALPESFGRLKSLKRLDVSGNELQDVPPGLADLPLLEELILSLGPLEK